MYEDASLAVQLDDMNPGIAPSGLSGPRRSLSTASTSTSRKVEHRSRSRTSRLMITATSTTLSVADHPNRQFSRYEIHWFGHNSLDHVVSPDGLMTGEFVRNSAQMEWSARVGDYQFVSDPASTSSSSFAEIGQERNGIFFPGSA